MKVLVVLLVATAVASQTIDLKDMKKMMMKPHLFKHLKPTTEDLLLKEKIMGGRRDWMGYTTPYTTPYDMYDTYDLTNIFGERKVMYTFEELMSHPYFKEYFTLPYFRQLWQQYPDTVVKKYVESPFFQHFFTVPEFKTYFINPTLFYKYIVPQVNIIYKYVTEVTPFDYGYTTPTTEGYTPYMYTQNNPLMNIINKQWTSTYPYTTTTPYTMNHKYLLEKMMNHLNVKKIGDKLTETFTDVKMLPNGQIREKTVGKVFNPITETVKVVPGDMKMVDEKIIPESRMFYPYENTETIKDTLLKHIILNKMFSHKKTINPEVYETLFSNDREIMSPEIYNTIFNPTNKYMMTPEIFENVLGYKKHNNMWNTPETMYETLFNNKKVLTPEIFNTVFGEQSKKYITPEMWEMLMSENKRGTLMTPETFEPIFGKKIYSPEVYGNLFEEEKYIPEKGLYDVTYEPLMTKKMMTTSPLLHMLMKNKRFNTLPVWNKKMMETEKLMEEIEKEKIIDDVTKNTLFTNKMFETEIPTMMEIEKPTKFHHVPLTFGKPVVGSVLDEIKNEKEIFNKF